MKTCFKCRKEVAVGRGPARGEECPFCSTDLKACMNCKHFDRGSYNECRETQAERVTDKEKSNFCDHFVYMESTVEALQKKGADPVADPLKDLKDLFK